MACGTKYWGGFFINQRGANNNGDGVVGRMSSRSLRTRATQRLDSYRSSRNRHNIANIFMKLVRGGMLYTVINGNMFFFSFPPRQSLACTPHLISKSARVINTSTPLISPRYRFRGVHAAAAIPTNPRPQSPLLPHHSHHRLNIAPRV